MCVWICIGMALLGWTILTRQFCLKIFYRLNTQRAMLCKSLAQPELTRLIVY
jgi:hypothetical protein